MRLALLLSIKRARSLRSALPLPFDFNAVGDNRLRASESGSQKPHNFVTFRGIFAGENPLCPNTLCRVNIQITRFR